MYSYDTKRASPDLVGILSLARQNGIRLWLVGGELRYSAPKDAPTRELLQVLRSHKKDLTVLLERSARKQPFVSVSRHRPDRIPLTHAQRTHWRQNKLGERPGLRQVVSGTRLVGPLDINTLRQVLDAIVSRHEALRTRIVISNGTPEQCVYDSPENSLSVEDLTDLPEALREGHALNRITHHLQEPIDTRRDPLAAYWLLRLRSDEHWLVVAMEHIVSDGCSMGIFLREVFTAYAQLSCQSPISLPPVPVQFSDFALWQNQMHASWIAGHGDYWTTRMRGGSRARFPADLKSPPEARGWDTVKFEVGTRLRSDLQARCREINTTLAMGVFAAYVALLSRWCQAADVVVGYQTLGRLDPRLDNTIGPFSSVLFLRLTISVEMSWVDLVTHVTEEYCRAHDHHDLSYLEAQIENEYFTHASIFNWRPREDEQNGNPWSQKPPFVQSPLDLDRPSLEQCEWENDPTVVLADKGTVIAGTLDFPLSRFYPETMKRFSKNFASFLEALVSNPEMRLTDVSMK